MTATGEPSNSSDGRGRSLMRAAQVIVVSSVMFTFISYWRTAAVVLCDLASTAYYIGGIVEQAIGPAAPWFILAVMLFSYAVRSVYIESCSLFVRGGVYRVVKEALGGFLAKLSVSALMFDYVLTGPTSGVSAGSYIMGLVLEFLHITVPEFYFGHGLDKQDLASGEPGDLVKRWGAVVLACAVTIYFFRQNLRGIHESSDKALKIMYATTVMAVVMLVWCGISLGLSGPVNAVPWQPDLDKKWELATQMEPDPIHPGEEREIWIKDPQHPGKLLPKRDDGHLVPQDNEALKKLGIHTQADPLGFLGRFSWSDALRRPVGRWFSLIGVLGLLIAFGHSILAMSGEETLAQVYREVESPKLPNFKKAAFIVFVYSLLLTAGISFLAVWLIPDEIRMKLYADNLIGGLARHVAGPPLAKLCLEVFVVVVGFLILSGAVNTAIIGSNGVLNRVAEDGVLPDSFLKPHPRYGTTYRLLYLITALQLATILFSRGDMIVLGEAYAFGVVWSFVFKALAMVVLRFKDRSPREFKVPLNIRIGTVEIPIGLGLIFLVLACTAVLNFFTKEVATLGGIAFTAGFLTIFIVSERFHERRRRGTRHEHREQFNQATTDAITPSSLRLQKPYRKLVSIRSPQNLYMLVKTLAETDPATTDVIVMTAKVTPPGDSSDIPQALDDYDQQLMTAVVDRAEKAGKEVKSVIVPTNNPLYAIIRTAKDLQVQELVVGASNKYTADEQLEQIAFYWMNVNEGQSVPLTVRILGRDRDVHLDLAGGNRIPRISERRARSVAELRAAGVGVDRVLLAHYGDPESGDLFDAVLTMLDPQVILSLVPIEGKPPTLSNGNSILQKNLQRAEQLGRAVDVRAAARGEVGAEILRLVRDGKYDLLILGISPAADPEQKLAVDVQQVLREAPCQVFLASPPAIPLEPEKVEEKV
ncbi:MAG TPA: amino acid permease [Gemmataceae bacterium]|nr:amino acid permease [Gemmataceae bacterium]